MYIIKRKSKVIRKIKKVFFKNKIKELTNNFNAIKKIIKL